jgi:hypothetical protein
VQISPLAVTRRATPKPPTFWRLVTLVIGVGVFVYGLSKTTRDSIGAPAYPGLLLTMIGLVIAGPWLTAQAARLFGRVTGGSSALLAPRRLADNPRGAFRAVTGPRARGLPRHDGRPDRATRTRPRRRPRPGRSATS